MAQRSRKIFTIFLLVVLCIATVAMPFAYATVSDPEDTTVKYYYSVLPFDTLRVVYNDGHVALYPLPTRFVFPSTTDSYKILLEDSSDPSTFYDLTLSFLLNRLDFVHYPYEDLAYAYVSLYSDSGSLAGATISFESRSWFFVGRRLDYGALPTMTLMNLWDKPSASLNLESYTVSFAYALFDRDNNNLWYINPPLIPSTNFTYDFLTYPAIGDNPSVTSIRFGTLLPSESRIDSLVSSTGGYLAKGSISCRLVDGYFGFRSYYVADSDYILSPASYIQNQLIPLFPDSNDFTTWLSDGVFGFLSFQIIPGLSLWMIFATIVAIPLVVMFLKLFAGG